MTITIKHAFQSAKADGADTSIVRPGDWNADHVIVGGAVVPVGAIMMWGGAIASIPTPWALCDGTANAPGPDLRDKFVVGATSDVLGVAKSNIEGSLKVSGGATGHVHSAHANLTHAGGAVGDHTGLTHAVAIANHPDLTHAALSHAASTFSHADHSVPSFSHTHAAITVTHADHSVAAKSATIAAVTLTHADHSVASANAALAAFTLTHADHSVASHANITVPSHSHAVVTVVSGTGSKATGGTAVTFVSVSGVSTLSGPSMAAIAGASIAAVTYSHADHSIAAASATIAAATLTHAAHSVASANAALAAFTLTHADASLASFSGTHAATTLSHGDHSFPSLSHQAIGTHVGTDYGVHNITPPAAHGTAGTLTHSFTQPSDHTISAHDTVSNVPNYYALAFIQLMAA